MEPGNLTEISVGRDLVQISGETVMIFTRCAMADWTLREYSRRPIYFRGIKHYLKGKIPAPAPYMMRYELAPWPDEFGRESTQEIIYDEAYVADRDRTLTLDRRQERIHLALLPLYPVLGFCWSGFKARFLSPIGFEAVSITSASLMVAFSFFMLEAVFVFYFHMGFLALVLSSPQLLTMDWLLTVLLPLDCAFRYDHILRGDEFPEGFLEWLVPRRWRRDR